MKNCKYNIDQVCTNPSCIFKNCNTYDTCMYCEAGQELTDSFELNPVYDLYGLYGEPQENTAEKENEEMEEKIDCCGDVIKEEKKSEINKQNNKEGVVIEGVGKDAEIVVNEKGGKQSKSPMAMHLIDPEYLNIICLYEEGSIITACIRSIAKAMKDSLNFHYLYDAAYTLEPDRYKQLVRIAKVLQEGAEKYEPNNWRLIPQEEHINHALIHLVAAALGDAQDNHIDHALTRIMMAYATKPSEGFSYTEYIKSK